MPGSIAKVTKNEIFVQTGDGVLCLQEVQLEGKKRMKAIGKINIPQEAFIKVLKTGD